MALNGNLAEAPLTHRTKSAQNENVDHTQNEKPPQRHVSSNSSLEIVYDVDGEILVEDSFEQRVDDDGDKEPSQSGDKQRDHRVPPDGGYGWFVVLGAFLSQTVSGSIDRGDGVFFLQFRSRFGKSSQLTAWPGAIVATLRLCFGPVAAAICHRYSVRTCLIISGLVCCISFFFIGLVPNFYVLFFSYGILQGVGLGFADTSSLIAMGQYFDKRRGIAAGLGSSGAGFGVFVVVPLFQMIFDNFGYEGACVIIAAYSLNFLVMGMLFRPLNMYYKFLKIKTNRSKRGRVHEYLVESTKDLQSGFNEALVKQDNASVILKSSSIQHDTSLHKRKQKNCIQKSVQICFPVEYQGKKGTNIAQLFNFRLLKNPAFCLLCVSFGLFTMSFKPIFTFIPALVKFRGFSAAEAAFVLSITGGADTVGRILAGVLDIPRIRPFRPIFYNAVLFMAASVSFVLPYLRSYAAITSLCGLYGLLTGFCISQKSVVPVDILGPKNMASAIGILHCFQGMGSCIGPPLFGALRDYFGDFYKPFFFAGGCVLVAGFTMIIGNVFIFLQRRKSIKPVNALSI